MSIAFGSGRRPAVPLSGCLPVPFLYKERLCGPSCLSAQRRCNSWGRWGPSGVCCRLYRWESRDESLEMVELPALFHINQDQDWTKPYLLTDISFHRLLIIEGLPPVCLGTFSLFFLADSLDSAWYLSDSERQTLLLRRQRQEVEASKASAQILRQSDVWAAVKDWKVWAFCVANFGGDIQLYSYSIFLPTIIKAINPEWSTLYVQALTVPCFFWSAAAFFVAANLSDAMQKRAWFAVFGATISITGQIMLAAGRSVAVRYFACFVIATGLFNIAGVMISWQSAIFPKYGKRSTAIGMQLSIGNCAGVAAPYVSRLPVFGESTADASSCIAHATALAISWAIQSPFQLY